MTIPIEFLVTGRPSSVNSTSAKKRAWKTKVNSAANAAVKAKAAGGHHTPYDKEVTVKVFFFPHTQQYLDIDNGLKHTIDAVSPPILSNDRSVVRLIAERFAPTKGAKLTVPIGMASTLATALMTAGGLLSSKTGSPGTPEFSTAIKVESYIPNDGKHW